MYCYGWNSVPKHLTMSGEEAARCYKNFNPRDQRYWVLTYDDESQTQTPRNANGMVDCFIMRGAKKAVISVYAWNNSYSNGGYCEYIARRLLHSTFNGDFTTKPRVEYVTEINRVMDLLTPRHHLAEPTQRAIKNHIYRDLLGV